MNIFKHLISSSDAKFFQYSIKKKTKTKYAKPVITMFLKHFSIILLFLKY